MKLRFLFLLITTGTLFSCKSSQFIYENGLQKIELVSPHEITLDDGVTETKATLKLTNINPNKVTIIGVGVRLNKKSINGELMHLTIKTRADYYKGQENYELKVSYKNDGETHHHKFEIPLTRVSK
ncbi:hypothetical protein [Psychroserpens damuponensis]|uniref:hypothetical protein n=1 Tax=Psychroserpens damuponensis TaxID=943936 RepID=UPI00058B285B|nr:hypothetical protein [Psychroserpens damuponensis]